MTTMPKSERGRAVLTRLGKETTAGQIATTWKPVRHYDFTSGMARAINRDDQLGLAVSNDRDPTKGKLGLPGGTLQRTVPLNLNEIGHWLSAGFARTTSGSASNYVHVFSSAGDPTDTLSLLQKWANDDWTTDLGVALGSIRFQAQKGEATARAILTLVGLSDLEDDEAPTGTVSAAYAAEDFADWRWQALWNDVVIGAATNLDMNMECGVERINGLSGDEWPTQHHFGDRSYSGSMTLYGRGQAFRGLGETVGKLTLRATHPSDPTHRYLKIDLEGTQFEKSQRTVAGGGMMSAPVNFSAGQTDSASAATITLANGVASY